MCIDKGGRGEYIKRSGRKEFEYAETVGRGPGAYYKEVRKRGS